MELNVKDIVEKYNNCIKQLDETMTCKTCRHNETDPNLLPCSKCYASLLGMPVNPTSWEA